MNLKTFTDLEKKMSHEGVLFLYRGPVWQGIVEEIVELVEERLSRIATRGIVQRILVAFIEQFQQIIELEAHNIVTEKKAGEKSWGLVLIGKEESDFYVMSGMFIDENMKSNVLELLQHLSSLDRSEAKKEYREYIRESGFDSNRFSGIVSMAAHSTRPLDYCIESDTGDKPYLSLKMSL